MTTRSQTTSNTSERPCILLTCTSRPPTSRLMAKRAEYTISPDRDQTDQRIYHCRTWSEIPWLGWARTSHLIWLLSLRYLTREGIN